MLLCCKSTKKNGNTHYLNSGSYHPFRVCADSSRKAMSCPLRRAARTPLCKTIPFGVRNHTFWAVKPYVSEGKTIPFTLLLRHAAAQKLHQRAQKKANRARRTPRSPTETAETGPLPAFITVVRGRFFYGLTARMAKPMKRLLVPRSQLSLSNCKRRAKLS